MPSSTPPTFRPCRCRTWTSAGLPAPAEVGFFETHRHETEGDLVFLGHPVRYERTPAAIRRLPPRLGQHTREVLGEAGYDPAAIDRLLANGAAVAEQRP